MIKILISLPLLTLLILASPQAVHAQAALDVDISTQVNTGNATVIDKRFRFSTSSSQGVEINRREKLQLKKDQLLQKRRAIKEKVEEKISTAQERIHQARQRIVARRCQFMKSFYRRLAHRFSNLMTRIKSRIDKLKTAGKDTSEVETFLAQAEDQKQQVQAAAETVATRCDELKSTDDLKTAIQALREALHNFRQQAKELRKIIVDILHALKALGPIRPLTTPKVTLPPIATDTVTP